MKTKEEEFEILEEEIKNLKSIIHTMVSDMYSLSIETETRTEFSEELQNCIQDWKTKIEE